MEVFNNNVGNYVHLLKENKWTQGPRKQINKNKLSIDELLLKKYNLELSYNDDRIDIDNYKMKLASDIDSNDYYHSFNYSKYFSKQMIQNGLHKKNQLSTLLFLSDVYKVNIYIYYNHHIYKINMKNYGTDIYFKYNNTWTIDDYNSNIPLITLKDNTKGISNLSNIIKIDIDYNINIYNKHLKSISNYKVNDLISICENDNINYKKNGKNIKKIDIYNNINEYYFNKD